MTSLAKIRKCVYPFPVYEAHFADNTVLRMSVWQAAGKPWDFARCRKLLETSHSGGSKVGPWPAGVLIVDGYLEHEWIRKMRSDFMGTALAMSAIPNAPEYTPPDRVAAITTRPGTSPRSTAAINASSRRSESDTA